MSRTLVKLDDTLFEATEVSEVKDRTSRLNLKKLGDEEVFDAQVFEENFEKFLENDLNVLTNKAYENIQNQFKKNIEKVVAASLGFDNSWGNEWRVDRTNGRTSPLTEYIGSRLQTLFAKHIEEVVETEKIPLMEELKNAVAKDFREQFRRQVSYQVRDYVEKAVNEFLTDFAKEQVEKMLPEATIRAKASLTGTKLPKNFKAKSAKKTSDDATDK